jgi:hypothetical protein
MVFGKLQWHAHCPYVFFQLINKLIKSLETKRDEHAFKGHFVILFQFSDSNTAVMHMYLFIYLLIVCSTMVPVAKTIQC